eukprot:tig00021238_g19543.t1
MAAAFALTPLSGFHTVRAPVDVRSSAFRGEAVRSRHTAQTQLSRPAPRFFFIDCRKVAVNGATGFVGKRLVRRLLKNGDEVVVLTRSPSRAASIFGSSVRAINFDGAKDVPDLSGVDVVINLGGASIADGRWSEARKKEIRESRVVATGRIVEGMEGSENGPRVLVNSSAIGYYGASETATFTESSPAGNDFLASVCKEWEAAANEAEKFGARVATVRTGIVLGREGGALAKMIPAFALFAGGPLGSGRQWFSWIHAEDLVSLLLRAADDGSLRGALNGTAPEPVTMGELCGTLGRLMARPSWLPVPGPALEVLLGEAAQVVLQGQRVVPEAAQRAGFSFQFPSLEAALKDVLSS